MKIFGFVGKEEHHQTLLTFDIEKVEQ